MLGTTARCHFCLSDLPSPVSVCHCCKQERVLTVDEKIQVLRTTLEGMLDVISGPHIGLVALEHNKEFIRRVLADTKP